MLVYTACVNFHCIGTGWNSFMPSKSKKAPVDYKNATPAAVDTAVRSKVSPSEQLLWLCSKLKVAEEETQEECAVSLFPEQQGVHQEQSAVPSGTQEAGLGRLVPVVLRKPPANHGPEGEPGRSAAVSGGGSARRGGENHCGARKVTSRRPLGCHLSTHIFPRPPPSRWMKHYITGLTVKWRHSSERDRLQTGRVRRAEQPPSFFAPAAETRRSKSVGLRLGGLA